MEQVFLKMALSSDPDLAAFAQIIEAHEAAVRAFIAVRLDDPFEAHDLAQEVFLLLWKNLEAIDLERPIRPWLLSVATNLIRQHRRKGRATPIGGSDAILDLLNDQAEADRLPEGPAFAALEHCLNQLAEGGRRLIRWRYEEGLEIAEICQRDGAKHSAVTMKLHRLRTRLLECMAAEMKEGGS